MSHKCYIPACTKVIADEYLMCPPHWRQVPFKIQNEVYKQYRQRFLEPEYLRAIEAARDAVVGKLPATDLTNLFR
jgi:hypothetical protein